MHASSLNPIRCVGLAMVLVATSLPAFACEDIELRAALRMAYPDAAMDRHRLILPASDRQAPLSSIQCEPWPAHPELLLLAVPLQALVREDAHSQAGDLEVIVSEAATGAVRARYAHRNRLDSDAWFFDSVSLDTSGYRLKEEQAAFGTRVTFSGSSRVNPFSETTLTLYLLEDSTLFPVLRDLPVERFGGEWDGNCAGEFGQLECTLMVVPPEAEGWADLEIHTRRSDIVARVKGDQCDKSEVSSGTTIRVTHDGTGYPVSPMPDG